MKTKINALILGFMAMICLSCEETISDIDLPYVEKLVIRAVLEHGENVKNIRITHSIPPLESYDWETAAISDADVRISHSGKEYTLGFYNGNYYNDSLIIEAGEKYELRVQWKDLEASAETTVPLLQTVDSVIVKMVEDKYYGNSVLFYAIFKPISKASYLSKNLSQFDFRENNIQRFQDVNEDGKVEIVCFSIWIHDYSDFDIDMFADAKMRFVSYDIPFYDYYQTQYNDDFNGSIFSNPGSNVQWNIKGDGIGLFIGTSETEFTINSLK